MISPSTTAEICLSMLCSACTQTELGPASLESDSREGAVKDSYGKPRYRPETSAYVSYLNSSCQKLSNQLYDLLWSSYHCIISKSTNIDLVSQIQEYSHLVYRHTLANLATSSIKQTALLKLNGGRYYTGDEIKAYVLTLAMLVDLNKDKNHASSHA